MRDGQAPSHNVIDCGVGEIRPPADVEAENQIGALLTQHYPKMSWYVESNGETGIMTVQLPDVHDVGGQSWGFVLHLDKMKGWDDMRRSAIWAGGELLERANIDRVTGERYSDKVDRN